MSKELPDASLKKNRENGDWSSAPLDLAIIGLACIFPKADDLEAYWANIRDRVDCITGIPPTHWNPEDYFDPNVKARDRIYAKRGGFINSVPFNPMEFGISPKDIEAIDTAQLLGLLIAKQALIDAGYGGDREFDRERISVILGATGSLESLLPLGARLYHPVWKKALDHAGVDPETARDVVERLSASFPEWQENSFPGLLPNVVSGRIANRFDLGGTNCTVDTACGSSLSAVHLAAMELHSGRSDMAITGGVDALNDIFLYTCFCKTPALSPTGDAKPFDASGDGTMLGEGLGMIVLKRRADAERDGDRIYALLRGIGTGSDGKGNAIYAPNARGQARAIRRAYQQAGIGPRDIELIEAHGTGTTVGDGIELEGLMEIYGDHSSQSPWCALGGVKSQIGHTKAAAGSAGFIKTAMALKHKTLPPTIKVKDPLESLNKEGCPFYVNTRPRPWLASNLPRRAGLSAFGFGGTNFHVVLEEYGAGKEDIDWDGRVQIAAFSAEDTEGLKDQLETLPSPDDWTALRTFCADSRRDFNPRSPRRLLLVIDKDMSDVEKLKTSAAKALSQDGVSASPDGVFHGAGGPNGKLALLFPGQGSQYADMLLDLACRFPQMFNVLNAANRATGPGETEPPQKRLGDTIYPVGIFSEDARQQAEDRLKDTRVAQPAIGAVSLGLYRTLEHLGIRGDMVGGHSYGELTALCVSGRFTENDLHRLSRLRGALMAETGGEPGTMLAVRTDAGRAGELLDKSGLNSLVVANKNAPEQTVLSGPARDMERAAKLFEEAGIQGVQLKVSNAFHSPMMASAQKAFAGELDKIAFAPAQMPVYANATADPYPEPEQEARDILASQLVQPVEFIKQVTNMHGAGATTFLEVGPGTSLTGLAGRILNERPVHLIAVDASKGARPGLLDLARALAHLAALGHPTDLTKWDEDYAMTPKIEEKKGFTVSICGANRFEKKEIPPVTKKRPVAASTGEVKPESAPAPRQPVPSGAGAGFEKAPDAAGEAVKAPESAMASSRETAPGAAPVEMSAVQGSAPQAPTLQNRGTHGAAAPQGAMGDAIRMSQQNMESLTRLQIRTAQLHEKFLDSQKEAQQTLRAMFNHHLQFTDMPSPGQWTGPAYETAQPQIPEAPRAAAPEALAVESPAPEPSVPVTRTVAPESAPAPPEPTPPEPAPAGTDDARMIAEAAAKTLLEVVSQLTGYPEDMLELSMDLDTDLGVDSIKRVEIMSALAEKMPDMPLADASELGALKTLEDVVDYMIEAAAAPLQAPAPGAVAAQPVPAGMDDARMDDGAAAKTLLEVVSELTGYPEDMLELSMDLDTDLGVDSIKRVEIMSALAEKMPDMPLADASELGALKTLKDVVDYMIEASGTTVAAQPPEPGVPGEGAEPQPAAGPAARMENARMDDEASAAILIAVVSELTGYPEDMLELSMDLDTDLGVDSIKRVEIMSALAEKMPDMPLADASELGALKTLKDVVDYMSAGQGGGEPPAAAPPGAPAASSGAAAETEKPAVDPSLWHHVSGAVEALTGYPADALNQDTVLSEELGLDPIRLLDLCRQIEAKGGFQAAHPNMAELTTLGQVAALYAGARAVAAEPKDMGDPIDRYVVEVRPIPDKDGRDKDGRKRIDPPKDGVVVITADADGLGENLAGALKEQGVSGKLLDRNQWENPLPEDLAGLIIVADGAGIDDDFIKGAFDLIKRSASALTGRPGALVASVSRLDGRFGLNKYPGDWDPVSGGLSGLTKSLHQEWPGVSAKAIDLDKHESDLSEAAAVIVEELFADGPMEVGLSGGERFTLGIRPVPLGGKATGIEPAPGDVVIVSGGARGVTAETALALARKWGPTLVLLGRTPPPEAEPENLAGLAQEADIKKALFASMPKGTSPKEVEQAFRRISADREIRNNLDRIRSAGATAVYMQADVTDKSAVESVVSQIRDKFGPVRGLVHGAGVLADKRIEDKTPEQFARVYDTKVKGLDNLLSAIGEDPLKFMVMFSSSTGRFGRTGQIDYAAANEILNKKAQAKAALDPGCRVIAFNWGPWAGGMVNPGLEKVFKSEGLSLIPLEGGAEYMAREIGRNRGGPVEIVVLGPESTLPAEAGVFTDMWTGGTVVARRSVSLDLEPVLNSHIVDGRAILPGTWMFLWMAETALRDLPKRFLGFNDFNIHKPLEVMPDDLLDITLEADPGHVQEEMILRPVRLVKKGPGEVLIAEGVAVLGDDHDPGEATIRLGDLKEYPHNGRFYEDGRLFHGPDLQKIVRIEGYNDKGIAALISTGRRSDLITDPYALDAGIQIFLLWCVEIFGYPALPVRFGRFRQSRRGFEGQNEIRMLMDVIDTEGQLKTTLIEFLDPDGHLLARIEKAVVFASDTLIEKFKRNRFESAGGSGT